MPGGPIFIGGLDHSGKTPLRLMLSSHPNLVLSRRMDLWPGFYNRFGDLAHPENFEGCLAALLRHKHLRPLRPDPDRLRREFWLGKRTYGRLFALLHEHFAQSLGKPRWGDQTAFIERFADPIFAAYPDARMIQMIRDPRERFRLALRFTAHRLGKVGPSTAMWLHSVAWAKRNQLCYPDRYHVVRYESLMEHPRETLAAICSFLEEDFLPSMLTMEGAVRFGEEVPESTGASIPASKGSVPKQAPASQSPSGREIAFLEACAGRAMISHNYQLRRIRCSLWDRLMLYLLEIPAGCIRTLAWRLSLFLRSDAATRLRASCGYDNKALAAN